MQNVGILATRRIYDAYYDFKALLSLPSDIDFYRASTGTDFTSSGVLETKASDVARFDHKYNSSSGLWEPRGLLIEPSRTNLWVGSQTLNSGTGYIDYKSPTITTNEPGAPDGTNTFNLFQRTSETASYVGRSYTKDAVSNPYVFSTYAKLGSVGDYATLRILGSYPARADVGFNLRTGEIVGTATSGAFTADPFIQDCGNGIYRIGIATETTDAITSLRTVMSCNSNGAIAVDAADSVSNSNMNFWGMQLEQTLVLSSYIPTTTSAATQAIDQAYIDAPAWFDPTEDNTVIIDFVAPYAGTTYRYGLGIDDGTGSISNVLALGVTSGNLPFVGANISGTTYLSGNGASVPQGSTCSIACTMSPGANLFSANGATLAAGTLAAQTIPTSINRLVFGDRTNSDRTLGSCIKRFRKLKTPITDQSALNALTVVT